MKHKRATKTLGRKPHHRRALLKQLTGDLLQHGSIITTPTKAVEVRRHLEPLITSAKTEITLSRRRNLRQKLRKMEEVTSLQKVAKIHQSRAGGYTRITKLPSTRHDNAPQVKLDIIDFDQI